MYIYKESLAGILTEIVLSLYVNLGRIDIFIMLSMSSLQIHEHSLSFHLFKSLISVISIWGIFAIQDLYMFY